MPIKGLYGVFPIYKPSGFSTSTILSIIRKNLGVERVSHSGALNKYAEGLMVMGVGKSEKYNQAIQQHNRMYLIRGVLGVSTTTYDIGGDYVKVSPYYHITESSMREALKEVFVGNIFQTPPSVPAYRFLQRERGTKSSLTPARSNETEITDIELIDFEPPSFQMHVYTIGRIYPGSLVNDLGDVLDSAAHLSHLCRVQQGDFGFKEALHHYDWDKDHIQNNLYLPRNDPDLNNKNS